MWLTGFDAPSLHTMYVDKPGGLVVDYLGLAQELKRALAIYTESGGRGETALDLGEAVVVMLEKYEVCLGLFHGFDRAKWISGTPQERLALLPQRRSTSWPNRTVRNGASPPYASSPKRSRLRFPTRKPRASGTTWRSFKPFRRRC